MTRADFTTKHPHASEATIRANVDEYVTRKGPTPTLAPVFHSTAKEQPARKPSTSKPKPEPESSDAFYARHNLNALNHPSPSHPILERDPWHGAMDAHEAQRGNPVRFLVRVTSFRRRLLDEDNLCEKYVVDCCRYSGLLPGDAPETTRIEVCQQKVSGEKDERTEVVITEFDVGQGTLPLT